MPLTNTLISCSNLLVHTLEFLLAPIIGEPLDLGRFVLLALRALVGGEVARGLHVISLCTAAPPINAQLPRRVQGMVESSPVFLVCHGDLCLLVLKKVNVGAGLLCNLNFFCNYTLSRRRRL
jgi:hypothetical protein